MPRCNYCPSYLEIGKGVVEDGLWFHDDCYIRKNKKRLALLQNKIKTGKITLEESEEAKEIETVLINLTSDNFNREIKGSSHHLGKKTGFKLFDLARKDVFTFETKQMPAIICTPSQPIIPYEEQKLLEEQTSCNKLKCISKNKASRKRKSRGCDIKPKLKVIKVK